MMYKVVNNLVAIQFKYISAAVKPLFVGMTYGSFNTILVFGHSKIQKLVIPIDDPLTVYSAR